MRDDRVVRDPAEGLTPDGMIRTGASRARVTAAFEPVLVAAIEEFDQLQAGSAELHLYGSVATGMARVGESDVDLLLVGGSECWARDLSARLTARFADVCRSVEIGPAPRSAYFGDGDEAYGNRVFLRHYCVPLAGPDALRQPAPFPGDVRAARGFNGDIGIHLAQWRAGALARQVARKTLVAAAGVVSIRWRIWTTDREIAARGWVEFEPERRGELMSLLAWAEDERVASAEELGDVLSPDGIVSTVADRFAAEIGLWADTIPSGR